MSEKEKDSNKMNDRRLCRADIYLAVFFLFLAFAIFGLFALSRKEGQTLRISCEGQTIAELSLSQTGVWKTAEGDGGKVRYCLILYQAESVSCQWYDVVPDLVSAVPDGIRYNLLAVSASGVFMEAADCPDQICVHHIPIYGNRESIICLPHKLVVEITSGADEETLDGIAKSVLEGRKIEKSHWHETDG